MTTAPPLRIAQIAATPKHCPWMTNFCSELVRRGYDVCAIIDSSEGDLSGRLTAAGIRHYKVPMIHAANLDRTRLLFYLVRLPLTVLQVARILRRERIDIAHSHVFVANMVTRFACLFARVRHVAGIAGPRHLEARLTRVIDRITCGLDARIAGGCDYTVRQYRAMGVPEERLTSVYYGSSVEQLDPECHDGMSFRGALGFAPETPVVGLVAHFYPPTHGPQTPPGTRGIGLKGHDFFIAAARIVAKRFPQARFVLVGGGPNPAGERYRQSLIEACAADRFLSERVVFTGHRSDLADVLASFDVAVQCSLTEGLGGTIDALMMQRPLVATRVGGMPEAVRHEETGLLVPPADAEALAAAIERLLANRTEAQRFARAGRALMLQRFTLTRTGEDLSALYASIDPRAGGDLR